MPFQHPWIKSFPGSRQFGRFCNENHRAKNALAIIGGAYVAIKGFQTLLALGRGIASYFLAGPLRLGVDLRKVGEWAVVTGASDGIGKEYANQLAAKGLNVVLIARNREKTEQVAADIRAAHKVLVKVITIDLSQMKPEGVTDLQDQLRPLSIALLINNAGVYPDQERFLNCPPGNDSAADVIHLNITAMVLVTRAILPLMLAQGKGYIMNMGSVLGEKPVVGASLYGATKTFVDYFSQALDYEYASRGVRTQAVMTGLVRTKMITDDLKRSPMAADAKDFAASALALIGVRRRHHGHWKHALMSHMGSPLPLFKLLKD